MEAEIKTTRRGFFGHAAGAYMAMGALATGAVLADPIFEKIAIYADLYRAGLNWPEHDEGGFDAHSDIAAGAMYAALETTPTTPAGMLAYLAFVESFETFGGVGLDDDDIKLICGKVRAFVQAQAA